MVMSSMRYTTRTRSSAIRAVSQTPSDSTEPDDEQYQTRQPTALKATLGLYHTPSLPLELTAAGPASQSQSQSQDKGRKSTVINLIADAGGLGLELSESMVERFNQEQRGSMKRLGEERQENWNGQYHQAMQNEPPPPPRPMSTHEPSAPPTPMTAHSEVMSYYQPLPQHHPHPHGIPPSAAMQNQAAYEYVPQYTAYQPMAQAPYTAEAEYSPSIAESASTSRPASARGEASHQPMAFYAAGEGYSPSVEGSTLPPRPASARGKTTYQYQPMPAFTPEAEYSPSVAESRATATPAPVQHSTRAAKGKSTYPPPMPPYEPEVEYSPSVAESSSTTSTSTKAAPQPATNSVSKGKAKGKRIAVEDPEVDEKERKAERELTEGSTKLTIDRREINRKSARMFRERRKVEADQREHEIAIANREIARLRLELVEERAERARLEGVVRSLRRK